MTIIFSLKKQAQNILDQSTSINNSRFYPSGTEISDFHKFGNDEYILYKHFLCRNRIILVSNKFSEIIGKDGSSLEFR